MNKQNRRVLQLSTNKPSQDCSEIFVDYHSLPLQNPLLKMLLGNFFATGFFEDSLVARVRFFSWLSMRTFTGGIHLSLCVASSSIMQNLLAYRNGTS